MENPELSPKEYRAAALMTETSFERVFIDGTTELFTELHTSKSSCMIILKRSASFSTTMKNEPSRRASKNVPTAERGFRNRSHRGSLSCWKAAREEFKRRAKGGYTCPIEPETVPTAL